MPIYKGQNKIVGIYKGTTKIAKIYKGTNVIYSSSKLPAEFQEVEYIETAASGPYINSNYIFTTRSQKIIIEFESIYNYGNAFFGSQTSSGRSNILWRVGNNLQFGIGNQSAGTVITSHTYNTKHKFECESLSNTYSCKLDNVYVKENESYTGTNITNLDTYIFANNLNGTPESPSSLRVYNLKIYDNNILVRNFVPCYRKADNVAGLYDLVNGVFYTNAGSSSFIIGGNV